MSAHAADEPADAQRDSHRGIRPTFDSVAQKLFQRCNLVLRGLGRVYNGVFGLPIRLAGCVFGLPIHILGGTGCLLDLPFCLGLHVASSAPKSLFDTAAQILGGASKSIFIHEFAPCPLPWSLNNPSTIWFDASACERDDRLTRAFALVAGRLHELIQRWRRSGQ